MLKTYCQGRAALIDEELARLVVPGTGIAPVVSDAMHYSLFAGGKRLRPILLMAAADAVGGCGRRYLKVACALEMIHTYSLIHDDLPAMDNDDFRRGKPTNHKVYGEGMAILAGDALLTLAFDVMLRQTDVEAQIIINVAREIGNAAGPEGMVGGQAIDLASAGKTINTAAIECMHRAKTGALFKAAVRAGAMLAAAGEDELSALTNYAENFGLAFQITDDILDVTGTQDKIGKPVGSDVRNDKATYVTMYSLEEACQMAARAVEQSLSSLDLFGAQAEVLRQMVRCLITRDN